MYKVLLFLYLFFANCFAIEVNVVATVGDEVITSYDLKQKIKLMKIIEPNFNENIYKNELLDGLIREKLLINLAVKESFDLPKKHVEEAVESYIQSQPNLKTLPKNSTLYRILTNQIKSEIILITFARQFMDDELEFSEEEIMRFKNSYNSQSSNKINNQQSKELLTEMKLREAQSVFLKSLTENTLIEKK